MEVAILNVLDHLLSWPVIGGGLVFYGVRTFDAEIRERIAALRSAKAPGGAEMTFDPQGGQNSETADEVAMIGTFALSAETNSDVYAAQVTGDYAVADPRRMLRFAMRGWAQERIWRVLDRTQLTLLLANRDGRPFTDTDARPQYDQMNGDVRATWAFERWIGFLADAGLIARFASGNGLNYVVTKNGQSLLQTIEIVSRSQIAFPPFTEEDLQQMAEDFKEFDSLHSPDV